MPCVVPTCGTAEGSFTLFPCHESLSERWLKAIQVGCGILVELNDDRALSQTEICMWHFGPNGKLGDDDENRYQEPRTFINGIGDQVEIDSCRLCLQFYPSYCMVSMNGNLGGNDIKSNVYEALRIGFMENDFLNLVCMECLARLELLNSIQKDFAQAEVEFQQLLKIAQDSTNDIQSTIKLEHPSVNFIGAELTPDPDYDIIEEVIRVDSTPPKRISGSSLNQKQPMKVHESKLNGMDHEVKTPSENAESIVCETCGKLFMYETNLNEHVRVAHTSYKLRTCNICYQSFTAKTSLERHMLLHTNEKPHRCTNCDASFRLALGLRHHMYMVHDGKNPHVCSECKQEFTNYHALCVHKQSAHLKKTSGGARLRRHLISKLCDVSHAKTNDLEEHSQASHANETYPYLQCLHCPESFLSEQQLDRHKDIHTDKYACKECGIRHTNAYHLQSHMNTHSYNSYNLHNTSHTRGTQYECDFCEKAFVRKDHLVVHRRVHTGEKPFQCTNCLKQFKNPGSYWYHKKRCQVPLPKVKEENLDDLMKSDF